MSDDAFLEYRREYNRNYMREWRANMFKDPVRHAKHAINKRWAMGRLRERRRLARKKKAEELAASYAANRQALEALGLSRRGG